MLLEGDMNAAEDSVKSMTSETSTDAVTSPKPKVAATKKATPSDAAEANPSVAASPPKPKAAAAGGKKAAKAVAKPLLETMVEDVIPQLTDFFKKEDGVSDVDLVFDDNQVYMQNAGSFKRSYLNIYVVTFEPIKVVVVEGCSDQTNTLPTPTGLPGSEWLTTSGGFSS